MNHPWIKGLHHFVAAGMLVFLSLTVLPAKADAPQVLNYQGQLTNAAGVPVSATLNMVFSLYGAGSGGSPLWSETQSVSVSNGLYSVMLGQVTSFPSAMFSVPLFLGITVGSDAEMTPRITLASSPYALQSGGCSAGSTNCFGTCKNLSSDLQNCGACGVACAQGQVCTSGACVSPTKAIGTACGQSSECASSHCVTGFCCDTACTTGGSCGSNFYTSPSVCNSPGSAGTCMAGPTFPIDNSNICRVPSCNPSTGISYSNASSGTVCGVAPNSIQNCDGAGTCGYACIAGYADCDGNRGNGCEINLNTDPNNCGACGQACVSGQFCAAGACQSPS
jgi:hypothetical protein